MPDVMQQVNELKSLPDQALQFELANPSGAVPAYLVLAEAQRRQLLRSSAQAQQSQQPIGSVYDDVIRSMMARQPPQPGQAPAGMTPPPASPPSTPQNARPPLGMAEGGEVDEDEGDDGGVVDMPTRFNLNDAIPEVARRHNLDPAELYGIVKAESNGDPNAVSPKGAIGLMQLLPSTARKYGMTAADLRNPEQNLEAGASYLDDLYNRFGSPRLVHAAYNAGPGAVNKYGGVPPYKETRNYVGRVDDFARQYSGANLNSVEGEADRAVESESPPVVGPPAIQPSGLASLEPPDAGAPAASTPATPDALADNFPRIGLPQAAAAPRPSPAATQAEDPYSRANLTDTYNTLNQMRSLPVQQNDREAAIQKMIDDMYAESAKRKKPTVWDFLTNFGLGMASTPSHSWGQSIAGGLTGMAKGVIDQKEDARKEQLQAMGVDMKLDDQMRTQQNKMIDASMGAAKVQQQAIDVAAKTQGLDASKSFEDLRRMPGAVYGPSSMLDPKSTDFTFTQDPRNPTFGLWTPPATRKAPRELLPALNALGGNPITGKPYAVDDPVPYAALEVARKQVGQVWTGQQKHVTTQGELNAAAGIQQTLQRHPELPQVVNPDGTPKDPAALRVSDLPATVQNEALWRIRLIREGGWTPKLINQALTDKDTPLDLAAQARQVQLNQATQAGNMTTARTTATQNAKQALQAKEGAILSPNGQKIMGETDNVGSTIDQLLDVLKQPQYANDRNPLTLAGSWAKYRMGIGNSDEDELGNLLSKLSLTSVQAAMPYARASRNMKWIEMIQQHLPNPPFDSPANMLQKLQTARRGILGIERSALQYDVKNATTNAPAPALTPDRVQQYLRLAGGDQKKAIRMAQEDGWGPPSGAQ